MADKESEIQRNEVRFMHQRPFRALSSDTPREGRNRCIGDGVHDSCDVLAGVTFYKKCDG